MHLLAEQAYHTISLNYILSENVVDPEGSIINVSRADDEQAITIDPALSSVIKPHQVRNSGMLSSNMDRPKAW